MRQPIFLLTKALSVGILLLPTQSDAISIWNFRMSDRPNGPGVTQFPSGTSMVYAIFDYAQANNSRARVTVYNAFGSTVFELTHTYNGAGTDSVRITGNFGDGRYLTVIYVYLRGYYSPVVSGEWTIGLSTSATLTPSPTATSTPTMAPTMTSTSTPTPTLTLTATPTPKPSLNRIFLPAVFNDYGESIHRLLCDGGFEAGHFEPCWQHGGELGGRVVDYLDTGEPVHAGHYSAVLGDPSLGPGLPTDPPIPIGSAWIEQATQVPDTVFPRLSFWYRIITYDVARDAEGQWYDLFEVRINGEQAFWDGNRMPGTSQQRHNMGWRREQVDLSRWRGQTVTVRFANWNGYTRGPGAELYNTWTYVDEAQVQPR